ncbi:hypothetical protein WMY93_032496 [Mugilogobius chulae]|uniref:Thyroglobulin type-1 domain-containing protein n=1 Tax=Mugilogobius chulae TaxID=88201 RepID=A0AAW0MKL0_9GOBI
MWCLTLCTLLLLEPLHSIQRSVHTTTAAKLKAVEVDGRVLEAGEPCGIYTLKCGPGLKCVPPKDDQKPLKSLRDGKGQCRFAIGSNSVQSTRQTTETAPTEAPEEAPCRKRLSAILSTLGSQVFRAHQEIYLPNCDRRGFFKRRQCWSSRGRLRGKCWCVDENGTLLNSDSSDTGC